MLDDINILNQRDPGRVLAKADDLYIQVDEAMTVEPVATKGADIRNIIIAGMGGSSLAADTLKALMYDRLDMPYEVVKDYNLPAYTGEHTLVIVSSHSGNTEEAVSCYKQAIERGCQVGAIASGGQLLDLAHEAKVPFVAMRGDTQPRMAMIMNLRAMLLMLGSFGFNTHDLCEEMAESREWLRTETESWSRESSTDSNYAKQLALLSVGKTPVFYGGPLTAAIAYKWKISWNENAKNLSFCNQYPEFSHNEFIGWSSHPVEKPFVVFDIISDHESIRIIERMELSDRLLSGMRPKAHQIRLQGATLMQQLLWGSVLADYVSIYVALLNGVNPEPVELIEKFKQQLS